MKKLTKYALGAAFALALPAMPAAAQDIDNTGSGPDGSGPQPFGAPNTSTYGQTFTAGGSAINSFSLFLNERTAGSGPLDFKGYLAEWDGTKASNIVYTSSGTFTHNDGGLAEYMFNLGGLGITAGATYVAFLSISDLPSQPNSTFRMSYAAEALDSIDGTFVFMNNGTDFGMLTTNDWSDFSGNDVLFKADFDAIGAVPEPATWAFMIFGFGAIGGALRRRRQTVKVSYA